MAFNSGDIFFGVSDRDWILEGANVHVSIVGFDDGTETQRTLDELSVKAITPELGSGVSASAALALPSNADLSFMGITPAGPFDIPFNEGLQILRSPNPNGRASSDVIRPYLNGRDINQRSREQWTIDFGTDMSLLDAAAYELAMEHVKKNVQPQRETNNRDVYREKWWLYAEARPAMRRALAPLSRYIGTCMVAKHRIFVWMPSVNLPANVVIVIAKDDDFTFGVVHSRLHRVWSFSQGTQLREKESGDRYTPTTCFETFPFPEPTDDQRAAIAAAAKELDQLRSNWLNPPEWTKTEVLEFPGSVTGPWSRYVHDPDPRGIGTVRYPRLIPKDEPAAKSLAKRTLTNLYNERPTWLTLAHKTLDATVATAYTWPPDLPDEQILERLLALNLERSGTT